tara:strand:+ start:1286 stop:2152 length:867 start_codon:yes stop_codon:yes gene_type:complete
MNTFFSIENCASPPAKTSGGKPSDEEIMEMTVLDLKNACKELGIKGSSGKNKDVLRGYLKDYDPSKVKPNKKSGKDNTQQWVPPPNFQSEFIEDFMAKPEDINPVRLKRACKVFRVKDPDDPEKNFASFGAKSADMIELLSVVLEGIDLDDVKRRESDTAVEEEIVSSSSSSSSEDEEDDASNKEEEKPILSVSKNAKKNANKKAKKKAEKAKKKAEKAPEPVEDDEPDEEPKVEDDTVEKPPKRQQVRPKRRTENKDPPPEKNDVSDLPDEPPTILPCDEDTESDEE